MNTNNIVLCKIEDIVLDSQKRLDVLYWSNFKLDFNANSRFKILPLKSLGKLRTETVKTSLTQLECYYPFKITYKGEVALKKCISGEKAKSYKRVREGDLVFSRINCCRGAIGVIKDFQDGAICTNETHVYTVTNRAVLVEYLQIILRHSYYQDLILTKCTGASLERMRFGEKELLEFMVPIPDIKKQRQIIETVNLNREAIEKNKIAIEKEQRKKDSYILSELGIELDYQYKDETAYLRSIDSFMSDELYRLDFEYNRPSFESIKRIFEGKYPVVTIDNTDKETKILLQKITSGSTPENGIYEREGIKFIQAQNVLEDYIDDERILYVNDEFHSSLKRSQLNGGEVLITIAGTIGRAAVNSLCEANVNQAVAVLRVTDQVNPLYLSAFLNSAVGKIQFDKYRHDFGTPNINQTELGHLFVALPKRSIQDKIADNIGKSDDKIRKLKCETEVLQKQTEEHITKFLLGKDKYDEMFKKDRN